MAAARRKKSTVQPSLSGGAWGVSATFGLLILLILLAGSDKPPPVGFLAVIVLLVGFVIAGVLVIPTWWRRVERRGVARAGLVAVGQGVLVGAATAAAFSLSTLGEPDGAPTLSPGVAFILVVGAAGAVVCLAVFVVAWALGPNSNQNDQ